MIKINLLPQRKAKRSAEPGMQQVYAGVAALLTAAAAVFLLIHLPKARKISELEATNAELMDNNRVKQRRLAGPPSFDELKKVVEDGEQRKASIQMLLATQATPAYLIQELGDIFTTGHRPTMTIEMTDLTGTGPKSDPNRRFDVDWHADRGWISAFDEKGGVVKLEGGAESGDDVTQIAKRFAASVYFTDTVLQNVASVGASGAVRGYFQCSITGKVVY